VGRGSIFLLGAKTIFWTFPPSPRKDPKLNCPGGEANDYFLIKKPSESKTKKPQHKPKQRKEKEKNSILNSGKKKEMETQSVITNQIGKTGAQRETTSGKTRKNQKILPLLKRGKRVPIFKQNGTVPQEDTKPSKGTKKGGTKNTRGKNSFLNGRKRGGHPSEVTWLTSNGEKKK